MLGEDPGPVGRSAEVVAVAHSHDVDTVGARGGTGQGDGPLGDDLSGAVVTVEDGDRAKGATVSTAVTGFITPDRIRRHTRAGATCRARDVPTYQR